MIGLYVCRFDDCVRVAAIRGLKDGQDGPIHRRIYFDKAVAFEDMSKAIEYTTRTFMNSPSSYPLGVFILDDSVWLTVSLEEAIRMLSAPPKA